MQFASEDEPCKGVWACSALYRLGEKHQRLSDEEIQIGWKKLKSRPVGSVRKLLEWLPNQRRETWMHHLSQFAKTHKAVERG
jgi:hypothetical protein